MILRALLLTLLVVPASLAAQGRDSVLLARDIDGSGTPDRIAIEFKRGREYESQLLTRTALYLDRKLKWSSGWSDEVDGAILDTVMVVPGGGSLIELGNSFGDASFTTLLLVRRGTLRVLAQHTIDYDRGDFRLRAAGNDITVDASLDHLKANGKDVISSVRCREPSMAMAQLAFDPQRAILTLRRQYCTPPRRSP